MGGVFCEGAGVQRAVLERLVARKGGGRVLSRAGCGWKDGWGYCGSWKGLWDDLPAGLKAAKVDVRTVEDVKKVVDLAAELDDGGGGQKGENGPGREHKMEIEVVSHDEAGNYGCGFSFL